MGKVVRFHRSWVRLVGPFVVSLVVFLPSATPLLTRL